MKLEYKSADYANTVSMIIVVKRAYVVNGKGPASLDQDGIDRRFALAFPGLGDGIRRQLQATSDGMKRLA